jgi:hypothetical protein
VRTLVSHAGGGLEIAPADPRGTRVTLRFGGSTLSAGGA